MQSSWGWTSRRPTHIILSQGITTTRVASIFPVSEKVPKIFIHKDAFNKKYLRCIDGNFKEIGIPWTMEVSASQGRRGADRREDGAGAGVTLIAEIPDTSGSRKYRKTSLPMRGGEVIHDDTCGRADARHRNGKGPRRLPRLQPPGRCQLHKPCRFSFPGKKIYSLLAGMHLDNEPRERLDKSVEAFLEFGIERVFPLHCTGLYPICELRRSSANAALRL